MVNIINHENVLFSIKSHKNIKTSTVIGNIIANLVSFGVAGRITDDFTLSLTSENLYIEATGYAAWGGLPETLSTEKISREEIKAFEVKEEGCQEIINIVTVNGKKMTFVRDNENKDDLGSKMARLFINS